MVHNLSKNMCLIFLVHSKVQVQVMFLALTASTMYIGSLRLSSGSVAVISKAFRGSKPPAYWKYPVGEGNDIEN